MSAPQMLRGQYSDLFGSSQLPVLEELFRYELEKYPNKREALMKVVPTDRDIWQYTETHDLPLFSEIPEGTQYSFNRMKQGYDKTLIMTKYGSGFSITEEMVDDGKWDVMADATRKLAKSGKESQEIQAMNIFNNGFGSVTTADGQPLFDQAHTLPSGDTYRNELASPADLSDSSLREMLADFETEFVGDSGIFYSIKPRVLLVHPDNKRLAMELVGSDYRVNDVSSGADNGPTNAMNALLDDQLLVVSSVHLTDRDAFFLLGAPDDTGLRIVSRRGIVTKASGGDVGFTTDSMFYKASYREKIAPVHPYGVFGSPGV